MSPERSTKERIFDAAEAIMLEKSFHSVGLNEILKSEQVPKGSFYHHFESKEQFGVEMLKHYVANASAYKRRILLSHEPESNPRQRLLTYLESTVAAFMANEGKCPCLVGKLASEVADFSDPMRQVLADGHREWAEITAEAIQEGLTKNALTCAQPPRLTATLIGDLWTGAMQRASIERNAEPLRATMNFIASTLLPRPAGAPKLSKTRPNSLTKPRKTRKNTR